MKKIFLIFLLGTGFKSAQAQKCDIAHTGVAIYNAANSMPIPAVNQGSNANFKFSIANFGTDVNCVIPANSVTAIFDFPTLPGGEKPFLYDGPLSFVSGYFTWTYNSVANVLNGTNNQPIPNGKGDVEVLVKIKGNDLGTGVCHLTIRQGGGISDNGANNYSGSQLTVTPAQILPVKLLSFKGLADKCDVALNWITASETANFSHFELEYSPDAAVFIKVGTITGKSMTTGSNYDFRYSPLNGIGYYRLKQVDKDGHAEYSDVVRVLTSCNDKPRIMVYPNPVRYNQKITVNITGYTGKINGELYNAAGQKITDYSLVNSTNLLLLKDLSAGTYTLYVKSNQGVETFKIIVTR